MGSLEQFNKLSGGREKEDIPCCICGQKPVPYALDYNGNTIGQCPQCDLRFVSPRPHFSTLLEHVYDDKYYVEDGPNTEALKDCEYYLDRVQALKSPPGLLFDVGASAGFLLETAAKRGWDIEGIDIQAEQVEYLRKKLSCPIHLGLIENLAVENRYDLLTLIHVLEHTLNPAAFLLKCKALIKPGGIVYAVFPNTASLNDRIKSNMSRWHLKSRRWKHFAADHHLWFFTIPTIESLAAKIDFPILSLKTIYPRKKIQNPLAAPLLHGLEKAGMGTWIELVLQRPV